MSLVVLSVAAYILTYAGSMAQGGVPHAPHGPTQSTCFNQPKDWLGVVAEIDGVGIFDMCHLDILTTPNGAGFGMRLNASQLKSSNAGITVSDRTFGGVSLAYGSGRCKLRDISGYQMLHADLGDDHQHWCQTSNSLLQASRGYNESQHSTYYTVLVQPGDRAPAHKYSVVFSESHKAVVTQLKSLDVQNCGLIRGAAVIGGLNWVVCSGGTGPDTLVYVEAGQEWRIPSDAQVTRMDVKDGTDLTFAYKNITTGESCFAASGIQLGARGSVISFSGECVPGGEGTFSIDSGGNYFFLQRDSKTGNVQSQGFYSYTFPQDLAESAAPYWVGKDTPKRHYFSLGFLG